jgi:hypothetical protein
MCKSPAALHRPKKEKQSEHREQLDERPYGINAKQERSSPTASTPTKRTLSVWLNKLL